MDVRKDLLIVTDNASLLPFDQRALQNWFAHQIDIVISSATKIDYLNLHNLAAIVIDYPLAEIIPRKFIHELKDKYPDAAIILLLSQKEKMLDEGLIKAEIYSFFFKEQ